MPKVVRSLTSGAVFLATGAVFLGLIASIGSCGAESVDEMTSVADGADVEITPFVGAGVQIEFGGTVIHVDPWSRGGLHQR